MLIIGSTFVSCAAIILGIYWMFVVRPEDSATRALRRRLTPVLGDRPAHTDLTKKDAPFSALKVLDAALVRSGRLLDPLKRSVANSGLPLTIGVVLLGCGFIASAMFAALYFLTSSLGQSGLLALIAGSIPYLWVRWAAARRLRKLEEQLPQAVDMIAV